MEAESQQSTLQHRFYHTLKFWDAAVYVLSIAGLLNAGYLWFLYSQPEKIGCSISECQTVRESAYSNLFGIDLPVWGFFFFLAIAIYSMLKMQTHRTPGRTELVLFVLYAFSGFGFSFYLTYVELFVINAICQWCVLSAIVATALFVSVLMVYRKSTPKDSLQLQPDESKQHD